MRAAALYRDPAYSPQQHRINDTAILDATVAVLEEAGWDVVRASERDVAHGRVPVRDVYLNMCQGVRASARLLGCLPLGAVAVNGPLSVLRCHRRRLVARLVRARLPFPRSLVVPTAGPLADRPPVELLNGDHRPIWVKRGDVHAQRPDDVLAVDAGEVPAAIAALAGRGIGTAVLQAHVPGPVVKFYAVAGKRFFHWYHADQGTEGVTVDVGRLEALAQAAARALGLEVFGGDAVIVRPDAPVLIDLNDWPSFAPVPPAAAAAIAAYVRDRAVQGPAV